MFTPFQKLRRRELELDAERDTNKVFERFVNAQICPACGKRTETAPKDEMTTEEFCPVHGAITPKMITKDTFNNPISD